MQHTEPAAEDYDISHVFSRMAILLNTSESLVIHYLSTDVIQQTNPSFNHLEGQAHQLTCFLNPGFLGKFWNIITCISFSEKEVYEQNCNRMRNWISVHIKAGEQRL